MIDNIKEFPLKPKIKDGTFLKRVPTYERGKCEHKAGWIIDQKLENVECQSCGEMLSPMWVLNQMAVQETAWELRAAEYEEKMKRLHHRSRTKCKHCGEITKISRE